MDLESSQVLLQCGVVALVIFTTLLKDSNSSTSCGDIHVDQL